MCPRPLCGAKIDVELGCDVCVNESWVMSHMKMRYAAYEWALSLFGVMIGVEIRCDVCGHVT